MNLRINYLILSCENAAVDCAPSDLTLKIKSIKNPTGVRNMPPIGELTQDQINMIACWVDDGALNN